MKSTLCVLSVAAAMWGAVFSATTAFGQLPPPADAAVPQVEPSEAEPPIEAEPKPEPPPPRFIRLRLRDGSIIGGDLSIESITVKTEFGDLVVPIRRITAIEPGLNSYPELVARIRKLVEQLGADDYNQRERAQKELAELGDQAEQVLQQHHDDENAERKRRVGELLKAIAKRAEEQALLGEPSEGRKSWRLEDTVVTPSFTMVGEITPKTFKVTSKYGPLSVALADVLKGERRTAKRDDVLGVATVNQQHLAPRGFHRTGLRVQRGDRVTVYAEGSLVMSPWGSNQSSSPDGNTYFGNYQGMPGGALIGRIGSSGQLKKIGARSTFVATADGELELAIAMMPQYANQGYQFPGQYKARIKISPP